MWYIGKIAWETDEDMFWDQDTGSCLTEVLGRNTRSTFKNVGRRLPVVHWMRVCLPMQETWV